MRRLEFIDSLRGIAALYIVAYHMTLLPDPHLAVPHWAQAVVLSGGTAVTLFFVVSAFSLCHAMKAHDGQPAVLTDFYIRRFFRIAPLFYVTLIFYAFRDALYFHAWHSHWEWAKSALFIFNFFPGSEQGIVWASWTIGVEMAFYAIFPVLFKKFRTLLGLAQIGFAALLATLVFHECVQHLPLSTPIQDSFYNFGFLRHLPVFIIGMLCWFIFHHLIAGHKYSRQAGATLILGSLWAYHALLHGALNIFFTDPHYWQAIIYSALLLGLAIVPVPVFVNRLSLLAGKISYSIYLLHPSIILFLFPIYKRIQLLNLPATASFLLCFATTLGIVIPASLATYRWIEKPGMNLGKRLLARRHTGTVGGANLPQSI